MHATGYDYEKSLLQAHNDTEKEDWMSDEKAFENDGDLSQVPFSMSGISSIHNQYPAKSMADYHEDPSAMVLTTQHFGPAPAHRVHRRTHNAAGHRRIKQTALLDENGFFAVDMPIPTRLAQFLPFKGVEEQKSTR